MHLSRLTLVATGAAAGDCEMEERAVFNAVTADALLSPPPVRSCASSSSLFFLLSSKSPLTWQRSTMSELQYPDGRQIYTMRLNIRCSFPCSSQTI